MREGEVNYLVDLPDGKTHSCRISFEYIIENDGIGSYEFWGAKGFDRGRDYPVVEKITEIVDEDTGMKITDPTILNDILDMLVEDEDFQLAVEEELAEKEWGEDPRDDG